MIGGLILAAGGGSRFGGRKQLAELDGRPLLEHAIDAMREVPAIERILVVLGSNAEEISRRVNLEGVETVVCEEWEEGIAASLRAGVEALSDCESIVLTLGDQPFITPQVIAAIADYAPSPAPAARATYAGRARPPGLDRARALRSACSRCAAMKAHATCWPRRAHWSSKRRTSARRATSTRPRTSSGPGAASAPRSARGSRRRSARRRAGSPCRSPRRRAGSRRPASRRRASPARAKHGRPATRGV